MKTKNLLLAVLLTILPLSGFAQEWDDIYANPTQSRNEGMTVRPEQDEPQKKRVVIVQGEASNMEVTANGRDIDEYNRRGNDTVFSDEQTHSEDMDTYQEYEYTDRIVRFHDPESSIKITGADEVIVYVGDDIYESYNNRGWNTHLHMGWGWGSYYPWYDPWYYGGWYSPWYYSSWYSPWYGGWGGWYSPWYYSRWYSPWYGGWYGGWYDPWYYGYGGYGYGYGYGGGYHHGFYDGYYSSLATNRSG
ncbi:MAG: hypothetical protein WC914_00840, partial [Proteiniphilum sp.]